VKWFGISFLVATNLFAENNALNFLHGLWEGQSKQTMPSGEVISMNAAECVYGKHNGRIAVVEGRHLKEEQTLGFGTFAVLSPKQKAGKYRFSIYLNDGTTREAEADIDSIQRSWIWTFDILPKVSGQPIVKVKYSIHVVNDQWIEKGNSSTDGGLNWKPFFEMTLDKKAETCTGF
jgi:hypothetical protein